MSRYYEEVIWSSLPPATRNFLEATIGMHYAKRCSEDANEYSDDDLVLDAENVYDWKNPHDGFMYIVHFRIGLQLLCADGDRVDPNRYFYNAKWIKPYYVARVKYYEGVSRFGNKQGRTINVDS